VVVVIWLRDKHNAAQLLELAMAAAPECSVRMTPLGRSWCVQLEDRPEISSLLNELEIDPQLRTRQDAAIEAHRRLHGTIWGVG
jgi:hypothetical protein